MCKIFLTKYCIAFLCVCWVGASQAEWVSESQDIMGTQVGVTFWFEDQDRAQHIAQKVMAEFHRIDQTLSPYKESSDLSRLNRSAYTAVQSLTNELSMLIDKSIYFSKVSHGAFDITFASVGWYYDYRQSKQPSETQLEALLPAVNYKLLHFDKNKKTLKFGHPDLRIDLGGIAKGYAVDLAADILLEAGVKNASVSAGGDSRIIGDRRSRPWIVGIKNPRAPENADESVIKLPLENTAISTSGDYERFFIHKDTGERVHHILNPKTGKSVKEVASVTIIGPLGVDTDPLSTTVFVLGVEKGLALIERFTGFDCVIIDRKGKVHYSSGLMPAGS